MPLKSAPVEQIDSLTGWMIATDEQKASRMQGQDRGCKSSAHRRSRRWSLRGTRLSSDPRNRPK